MPINAAERAEQLESERAVLVKAESDIQDGWRRLHNQEDLIRELQAAGHDTRQAKRLLELLKDTLVEWERHRILIKERVAGRRVLVDCAGNTRTAVGTIDPAAR